jgi:hypothetical protein
VLSISLGWLYWRWLERAQARGSGIG